MVDLLNRNSRIEEDLIESPHRVNGREPAILAGFRLQEPLEQKRRPHLFPEPLGNWPSGSHTSSNASESKPLAFAITQTLQQKEPRTAS
jgi:hypothetical protein